jgi:hypothetical protein
MLLNDIFYSVFWVSAVSVIWFCTDWIIHYMQLFSVCGDLQRNYKKFISENSSSYFPDFLYELSLKKENKAVKFIFKLASCPFCLMFWFSALAAYICANPLLIAPIYVLSLIIVLQIKRMM